MFMKLLSKRYSSRACGPHFVFFLWQIFYTVINVFSVGDSNAKKTFGSYGLEGEGVYPLVFGSRKKPSDKMYCTVQYMYLATLLL
jgi:hypothetical protein